MQRGMVARESAIVDGVSLTADVETPHEQPANDDGDDQRLFTEDTTDWTPACIKSLPRCFQSVLSVMFASSVGFAGLLLFGPLCIVRAISVMPRVRALYQDYVNHGFAIQGTVVERRKHIATILGHKGQACFVVVEYQYSAEDENDVGLMHRADQQGLLAEEGLGRHYRKNFRLKQNEAQQLENTVDLVVLQGRPASALLKSSVDEAVALVSTKQQCLDLIMGIFFTCLVSYQTLRTFWSKNDRHSHEFWLSWLLLGISTLVAAACLVWWIGPDKQVEENLLNGATPVGNDDEMTNEQQIRASDTLRTPLLAVIRVY